MLASVKVGLKAAVAGSLLGGALSAVLIGGGALPASAAEVVRTVEFGSRPPPSPRTAPTSGWGPTPTNRSPS